jgi:hypothetical protein
MSNIFYQANFCAECGNLLEPRRNWFSRYFCDDCAARRRRRGYVTPLSLLAGLLVIALLFSERRPPVTRERANMMPEPAAVSARDATPKQKLLPQIEPQERDICGARTKKGKPCRRMVLPGQRCAQHREMPSMIAQPAGKQTMTK